MYVLKTMSGSTTTNASDHVSFEVPARSESIHMTGVKVINHIPIYTTDLDPTQYEHLKCVDVSASVGCKHIDLLIGQNFSEALLPLQCRSGP